MWKKKRMGGLKGIADLKSIKVFCTSFLYLWGNFSKCNRSPSLLHYILLLLLDMKGAPLCFHFASFSGRKPEDKKRSTNSVYE